MPDTESVGSIVRDGTVGGLRVFTSDGVGLKMFGDRYVQEDESVTLPLVAGSVDTYLWTCGFGLWQVRAVKAAVSTAGGASAAVDVKVCPQGTAPASGTTQLTGTVALTAAGPVNVDGVLIATPTTIKPGDSLAADFSGTLTALVGYLTVYLKRIG